MSAVLEGTIGGFAVSKILDIGFAMAEAGLDRAAEVEYARQLETQGMTPEQVAQEIVDRRKATHSDFAKALGLTQT